MEYGKTVVTKFDLVCSNSWIPSFLIAISQAAHAVGVLFAGPFSDRFGRRKCMIISLIGILLFGFALPYMPTWWSFAIGWVGVHLPIFFNHIACAVYVVEILGPSKRSLSLMRRRI